MRTLKQYHLLERIGEGGMGVVYKARDTRLGRTVAIKCLSTRLFTDSASKQRFFKESQAASNLNHPNIVTIYELFNEGDSDYLVMEYVNGKTLEQVVLSKGLATRELLDYAVQIADALSTAHASGIVHRDIKPSNIMITDDGRVKVLDFGLAKVFEQTSEADELTRNQADQTAEGTIVGTAPYMSPEQAEGRPVDARTDIFSLGAVMYEMCTGQRAFSGESHVSTLAAVLAKDPAPIENLAPNAPRELQRVILRCLQKDPRRRFQSMLDLKLTLEDLKADSESGRLSASQSQPGNNRGSWKSRATVAGMAALIGAFALLWRRSEENRGRSPLALEQLTFDSGLTTTPAIAPDGKLIAYASDRAGEGSLDIWVQYRGGEPVRITRDPADEDEPAFSPDGTKIAYRSRKHGGGIYIVSSLGGEQPREIANFGAHPQFSPDGDEILFESGGVVPLSHAYKVNVAETGTSPVQVDNEVLNAFMPLWSPDGQHILFIGSRYSGNETETWLWVVPRNGGTPERVSESASYNLPKGAEPARLDAWLPGDRLIGDFSIRGRLHLFQARLHREPWYIDSFEQITFGTGMVARASVATDGTTVVSNEETDLDLWSLPLDAHRGVVNGKATRLTQDASREAFPSISVDGSKMAYVSELAGNAQIWFMDLLSGAKRPLTPPSEDLHRPIISMDGAQVAYHKWNLGKPTLHWMSTSGIASDHVRVNPPLAIWDWAPTGDALLVLSHVRAFLTADRVDLRAHKIVPFLKRPHNVFQTHISHDGRWAIAQEANVGVLMTRYDANHPENTHWRPLGLPGADLVRWSADDNTIYFVANTDSFRCVWGQRLDPASKQLRGEPFAVAHFHQTRRSLQMEDSGEIGLAVARDKIVLAEAERTGNIWMTKLQ